MKYAKKMNSMDKVERKLTVLQWAKEGYVLNPDAVGEERWTNCVHVKKAIYYSEHEVHEDKEAANAIIKAKQKEYNKASKERENKYNEAMAFREDMKTEWQWLQEGRIPDDKAKWSYGENLNKKYNVCAYGSKHYYCHIEETHIPRDSEELQKAIEEYKKRYFEHS